MKRIYLAIFILIMLFIFSSLTKEISIRYSNESFITLPYTINTSAQKLYKNRTNLEKISNRSNFYFKEQNNKKNFYNSVVGLVSTNVKKIIDVSSYQGDIDWNKVKPNIDGVILRFGFGSNTLDNKFEYNVSELKRLNIPYGIYLYSYAENILDASNEAIFTNKIIKMYDLNPTLGIYYDLEETYLNGKILNIKKDTYEKIINKYIDYLKNRKHKNIGVYTYTKFYNLKLNDKSKSKVKWIAQYNYYFTYNSIFKMWQYTDKGQLEGINTKVDMNVMFN